MLVAKPLLLIEQPYLLLIQWYYPCALLAAKPPLLILSSFLLILRWCNSLVGLHPLMLISQPFLLIIQWYYPSYSSCSLSCAAPCVYNDTTILLVVKSLLLILQPFLLLIQSYSSTYTTTTTTLVLKPLYYSLWSLSFSSSSLSCSSYNGTNYSSRLAASPAYLTAFHSCQA